jgi:hypothetical protein
MILVARASTSVNGCVAFQDVPDIYKVKDTVNATVLV